MINSIRPGKRIVVKFGLVLLLLAGSRALTGCGQQGTTGQSSTSAPITVSAVSYADARKTFKTTLVRHEAAPQGWEPAKPPAGVSEVEYSKNPSLKAWINSSALGPGSIHSPAVLFLHGGFAFGEEDWEMAEPYRKAGYIVMMPMLRGENGQAGEYSMFYNEVNDVLAAKEYLSQLHSVSPKRIFLAGHSVGGTLTLLSAMAGDGFRAATSFSGASDVVEWADGQPEYVPFDPKDSREFQMRSPINFATSFKCPTRIFYGDQEDWCKAPSEKVAELAQGKGLDAKAQAFPGDHFSAVAGEVKASLEFFEGMK